jgi:hypothetical protein
MAATLPLPRGEVQQMTVREVSTGANPQRFYRLLTNDQP